MTPNDAMLELVGAIANGRYPSLAWMVEWQDRVDELWDLADDDVSMRNLVAILRRHAPVTASSADLFRSDFCLAMRCRPCAERIRSFMPSLPPLDAMLSGAAAGGRPR